MKYLNKKEHKVDYYYESYVINIFLFGKKFLNPALIINLKNHKQPQIIKDVLNLLSKNEITQSALFKIDLPDDFEILQEEIFSLCQHKISKRKYTTKIVSNKVQAKNYIYLSIEGQLIIWPRLHAFSPESAWSLDSLHEDLSLSEPYFTGLYVKESLKQYPVNPLLSCSGMWNYTSEVEKDLEQLKKIL